MLDVKFQCWDREYSHMYHNACPFEHLVYVEMPQDDPEVQKRESNMEKINDKWFYFLLRKDVDLRQYIGSKDRKGNEIYNGDIVLINHPQDLTGDFTNAIGEVFWWDDEGGWYHGNNHGRPPKRMWKYTEVIGNVYEHNKLLEQEGQ